MDTLFDSQALGESPNPSNDFQAGEFAKSSDVSPVALHPAATFGSLVRITKDYRPEQVGQFGILAYPNLDESGWYIRFSLGSDYYDSTDFELVLASSGTSKELHAHLIGHLNTLLAVSGVDAVNVPALLFVAAKLHDVILFDADGFKRSDIDRELIRACDFLRFGYEDLTNGSKFGRRVAGVFIDAAFEKLKQAAVILSAAADSVEVL